MKCPDCTNERLKVWRTRPEHGEVFRERLCFGCGRRFMTVERETDNMAGASRLLTDKVNVVEGTVYKRPEGMSVSEWVMKKYSGRA